MSHPQQKTEKHALTHYDIVYFVPLCIALAKIPLFFSPSCSCNFDSRYVPLVLPGTKAPLFVETSIHSPRFSNVRRSSPHVDLEKE